jgi:pantoate--beta-alanine ligase
MVLERIETVAALRARLSSSTKVEPYRFPTPPTRPTNATSPTNLVGLVPTMGALHAGHAALVDAARRECDVVVVSIFVNPTQFNSPDDLARYPRALEADMALCRERGVDIVFAPPAAEVYPQPLECSVDVGHLADHLCGRFRPGHFRGVATVVLKLFQMVQPRRAYFGEKDAQQLAIVKRLAADFNVPVEIVEVPTVREADGLAMSSRNAHLSAEERAVAPVLYKALDDARRRIVAGDRDPNAIRNAAEKCVADQYVLSGSSLTVNVRLEYLEIVDPVTMQPVDRIDGPVRVAGAIWVGTTRLIDNVLAHAKP